MGTTIPRQFNFARGANTTALGHTSEFPVYPEINEIDVDRVVARRRKGKAAIYTFTPISDLVEFDGTDDIVVPYMDSRVYPLGVRFTVEALFYTTSVASNRYVVGRGGVAPAWLNVLHDTSSQVVVTLTDSAGNTATMTWTGVSAAQVCRLQVTRDGASVTGYLNGTSKTATLASATNLMASGAYVLGADNAGSYFLGRIDYFRIFSVVKTTTRHLLLRLLDPRVPTVLCDYMVSKDANGKVIDRGAYEMHASTSGTPTTAGSYLAANAAPVRAITFNLEDNEPSGYVLVRDRVYPVRYY